MILLEIRDPSSTDSWSVSDTLTLISTNCSLCDLFWNPLLNNDNNSVSQNFNQFKKVGYYW